MSIMKLKLIFKRENIFQKIKESLCSHYSFSKNGLNTCSVLMAGDAEGKTGSLCPGALTSERRRQAAKKQRPGQGTSEGTWEDSAGSQRREEE